MYIQQLYTGCLSEAAYYIESEGEAAIIDPLRDIEEYLVLGLAKERKATIKYIFETHFHADFVSGHLDLAQASGAPIVYGPETETSFPIYRAKDGEIFKLGKLTIEVLHTPGIPSNLPVIFCARLTEIPMRFLRATHCLWATWADRISAVVI